MNKYPLFLQTGLSLFLLVSITLLPACGGDDDTTTPIEDGPVNAAFTSNLQGDWPAAYLPGRFEGIQIVSHCIIANQMMIEQLGAAMAV